jgi:hypothetical protein
MSTEAWAPEDNHETNHFFGSSLNLMKIQTVREITAKMPIESLIVHHQSGTRELQTASN